MMLQILIGALLACGPRTTSVDGTVSAVHPGSEERFSGVLMVRDIDTRVRSVDAFRNESLILTLDDGTVRVLRPGAVDEATIAGHAGSRVRITAVYFAGTVPEGAAPIGPDGVVEWVGRGWKVLAVQPDP